MALPVALVTGGLAARLWNATRGLDELVKTTLPDDAFYYFGIARHVALGHPPSIDGWSPTNGYHPLWMAVLVAVHALLGTGDFVGPVRVALVTGALLDAGSSLLVHRICTRLGLGPIASSIALLLFVANPHQVVNATCGLETALALFLALLLFLVHLEDGASAAVRPVRFGLLAGLAVLARTDQAILVACLVASRSWALWGSIGPRAAVRFALVATATLLAVFAPWAAYCFHTTGTVVQSSGVALAVVHRRMPEVWGFDPPPPSLALERTLASVAEAASVVCRWNGVPVVAAGALLLGAVGSSFVGTPGSRRALRDRARALSPLLSWVALLFLVHSVGRLVFREWYTAPFVAVSALVAALSAEHAFTGFGRPALAAAFSTAAVLAWLVRGAPDWFAPVYGQELAGTRSTQVREGHSDCGIVSYFTGQGITNLDGIANQRAFEALLRRDLLSYAKSQRFQRIYVTDSYQSAAFFGPRYRESLTVDRDPRAVRVVLSEAEKDARVGPTDRPVPLGEPAGREYLDDGWSWSSSPRPFATSLGRRSELLLYVPRAGEDVALELELSAAVVNERGVQPVDVFLNDRAVGHFDVPRGAAKYVVPLREAVPGRNRVRLAFAAPKPRRAPVMDWWRLLEGDPVLAIEARSLWLHGGRIRTFDFPLVGDGAVSCDGCYPPEVGEHGGFRWTNGKARLTVEGLSASTAVECRLQIVPASPSYRVKWDGARLPGAQGTYLLPPGARAVESPHVLDVESDTFVPEALGEGADTRVLGVALERLEVVCWF